MISQVAAGWKEGSVGDLPMERIAGVGGLEDATPGRQIPASPVQQHSAATASSIAQGTKRTGASSKAADARLSVLNRKRKGAGQFPVLAARAAVGLGLHQALAHHVECVPPHTGTHRKIAQLLRELRKNLRFSATGISLAENSPY